MNSIEPSKFLRKNRAFSLIELLVVVAVIAIVAGFAVPAVTTMVRGSQLSQGSQLLGDQLALARQIALSKSRSVEVRFYRFGDPEIPGEKATDPTSGQFRALQVFEILQNGAAIPVGPIQRLPIQVMLNPETFSTILDHTQRDRHGEGEDASTPLSSSDPEIPGVGKKYQYSAIRFRSDGSTDLAPSGAKTAKGADSWYVTLHGSNDPDWSQSKKLPANYFTLQIDPVTGVTRAYRPQVGS